MNLMPSRRWPHWPDGLTEDTNGYYRFVGDLDRTAFDRCLSRVGRTNGPALLFDLWFGGLYRCSAPFDLSQADMAGLVASVWSDSEYPERALGSGQWIEFFRINGYSHDGRAAERPTKPVALYRGCYAEDIALDADSRRVELDADGYPVDPDQEIVEVCNSRNGMSWSSDLAMARRFADGGLRGRRAGQIFAAVVAPEHLLAYIGEENGRGEAEYVVDPAGLVDVAAVRR